MRAYPKGGTWDQGIGFESQPGVSPLSDRFAEMGGIPVDDDGGEQVEPGHEISAGPRLSRNSTGVIRFSVRSCPYRNQPQLGHEGTYGQRESGVCFLVEWLWGKELPTKLH